MSTSISAISFNNTGIKDNSAMAVQPVGTPVAQFTPLIPIMTERGPEDVQIINVDQFTSIYGERSLEPTSEYFTHQTAMLDECIRKGISTIGVKRIVPAKARSSSLTVGVDSNFPTSWFVGNIELVKEPTFKALFDFDTSSRGKWGDTYGVMISKASPIEVARVGLLDDTVVYNFRLVRVNEQTGRVNSIANKWGENETPFTLKPNSVGRGGIDYFFNEQIASNYINVVDETTQHPVLGKASFYVSHLDDLAKQSPNYNPDKPIWNQDLENLFDHELTVYRLFSGEHPIMFSGGDDGLDMGKVSYITERLARVKVYDDAVFEFLDSLTENNPFTDVAKYPYSTFVDTGFSFRTKLKAGVMLNTRRDTWALLGTFMVADHFTDSDGKEYFTYVGDQTEQELQAIGSRLTSAFRLYPESHRFGTAALRTVIIKNSGVKNNSNYKKRQSMVTYVAGMLAAYMGSTDGVWREQNAIDNDINRIVTGWSEINVGYQSPTIREMDATNSLTAIEHYDTTRYYIPIYRTIYPEQTSVLADAITMIACCYLERLGAAAWRQYVNVRMSDAKRMESIVNFINSGVENKFNNRFEFVPRVSFNDRGVLTEDVVVEIHATKAKTQTTFTIEANRRSTTGGTSAES